MHFFDAPYDRLTAELMARALDDAWATASLKVLGLSEDDWTEMAEAISRAVAGGLRNEERLQQIALDALDRRREILTREVFAAAINLESGAALAGLHPDEGTEPEGEGRAAGSRQHEGHPGARRPGASRPTEEALAAGALAGGATQERMAKQ